MTKVVVIGQGYVGLPLAQEASRAGLTVVGLDLSPRIVDGLNSGISHIDDLSNDNIAEMLKNGYTATSDATTIADADYVVICVPTPLGQDGNPDLTPVEKASASIAQHLTSCTTVILESTTYPGTTDTLVAGIINEAGHTLGEDYYLAFSPERIDPGNPVYGLKNTPKVVGGVTPESTEKAVALYSQFIDTVVPVRGAREAETAKLLENTYRHINIALVNEMAKFCHDLDIDLWDVIDAAATKPFGFQAFYPGPGVGGHCIPIDPNYLSYEVKRSLGYPFRFVELAQEINLSMPKYISERVMEMLNEEKKSLNGAKVLLLGVTYKANISDQRESPAVPVAAELAKRGAVLSYNDPYVENWTPGIDGIEKVTDLDKGLAEADIVILLQKHRDYDVDALAGKSKVFFDTRGVTTSDKAVRL
ncbi:nucleotide sugar dehydrogenase [Rothia nasimurium]|uniref:Nucleotide sugar dehydrogenase n=1 Tax=Rothia nasimurium TaxID=85336 RepID=A0A4Y9F5N7_9MICC|nr:nucleotide sugar dehydrogenase [Rothia nasimurium]MBF0807540.1 nucleotide sugar dehydrogenase [Rothia nasimurium]TFU23641.1 nucleotide sugar dehydrogenase [Rothia nasimurium]